MMAVFWSLVSIMMVVALLFIVPPLLRSRKTSAVSRDDLNTEVIKAQLGELEADLQTGKLDQVQYEPARKDLERELLYDLSRSRGDSKPRLARSGRWAALILVAAIPLCAVLLYMQLGSKELITILAQINESRPTPAMQQPTAAGSIEEVANQLAERMRTNPDDPKGWVLLAKTYLVLQRPADAARAYENVLRLGGGNDPNMLANYVDAIATANGGKFTDHAGELLLRALELKPDHVKALWLAGHWRNQSGEHAEAIRYWQQAAALLPDNDQNKPVITRQIQQARQQLGIAADSAQQAAASPVDVIPDNSASGVSLQVQVSLDPELITGTSPDDTVFIFARAVQGSRMPLAIVRKQVKDLPVSVTLDDSMAMTPQMVLSKFDQVTVGARVSKSGDAMPGSGDLQGTVSSVRTQGTEVVELVIDTKLP